MAESTADWAPAHEPSRRGLAVVRCGDRSLHASWAEGTTAFDVAVSYFGADAERAFPEARYVHRYKGGKWDGISAFFASHPELVSQYDYFWLPDDDLAMDGAAADRLLATGVAQGLELWQPALDRQSYFGHLITLAVDGVLLRHTNFAEIMAPVISRALLVDTLPLFGETRSGFGLDYLWPQRAAVLRGDDGPACAVLDSVAMTHTRPLGSALRATMKAAGGPTLRQEYAAMLSRVGERHPLFRSMMLAVPRKRVLGGIDACGEPLGSRALAEISLRSLGSDPALRAQPIGKWELLRYWATSFY